MRPTVRPALLASLLAACSPAAVTGNFGPSPDAAADVAATVDAPSAIDSGTVTPPPVDSGTITPPPVDSGTVTPPPVDSGTVTPPPVDSGTVTPPPVDSGTVTPPPVDAGALGAPEWVPLDVRINGATCPPLAPCGGNELGTWDVGGGCIEVATPSQVMSCPGARVTRASGRARGRVTFASGFARRASEWEVESELTVPRLCAAIIGGCPALQNLARAVYPDTTCVTEAGGDCRCTARFTGAINDADAYRIADRQIVSVSSGKRWNYCVAGDSLRYQDVSSSGTREAGIIQLTRRAP